MGFIGSTLGTLILESGVTVRAMVWVFKLAPMLAVILVNLSMASNTVLAVTILEMGIDMLESILGTRYMDLGSTTLPMATIMREHGTRVVGKVLAHTLFEMVTEDVVNGMLAPSSNLYHHYLMLFFEQFRLLGKQQRML